MKNMKNILLIEDDPFLIDIYTTKMKEEGFNFEVATDGQKGLEKLEEKKFDLLLLDIVLPQINGWEVLQEIKKNPYKYGGKELKIIILSNLSQKEEIKRGEKSGVEKYLIKAHYTPTEVIEEVKRVLK